MKTALVSLGFFFTLALAEQAEACGGCFHLENLQGSPESVVTGHRMVFAVSQGRTVLWDQIKYSGSPKEFAWVLPIRPGAYIEASTDAWFEVLEAVTHTTVSPPQVSCNYPYNGYGADYGFGSRGSGCGCGSEDSNVAALAAGRANVDAGAALGPPPVEVIHEGTVGSYETVTLRSRDGSALRKWLTDHGYAIPPDIDPIIDVYVSEGADFIALRLIPGAGVNAMTPVRVITPSGPAILPLRMVAAGTGPFVDIVLYVIAERRDGLADLTESKLDPKSVSYDFAINESNYASLRDTALEDHNGASYLTTFSARDAFGRSLIGSTFIGAVSGDIPSLYFAQANVDDGRPPQLPSSCSADVFSTDALVVPAPRATTADAGSPPKDAGRSSGDAGRASSDGGSIPTDAGQNAGKPGADSGRALRDASYDAAKAPAPPSSGLGPMEISSAELACQGHSDVAAALIGMHPDRVWLTRLEMNLPHEALSMDCHVDQAPDQSEVTNHVVAGKYKGDPCPGGTVAGRDAAASVVISPWAGLLALLGLFRRRRSSVTARSRGARAR